MEEKEEEIYSYTVYNTTARGKQIELFTKFFKSKLNIYTLRVLLQKKYIGLHVEVDEIEYFEDLFREDIYVSHNRLYQSSIDVSFPYEPFDKDAFEIIKQSSHKLYIIKDNFIKSEANKARQDIKYKYMHELHIEFKDSSTLKVNGSIPMKNIVDGDTHDK